MFHAVVGGATTEEPGPPLLSVRRGMSSLLHEALHVRPNRPHTRGRGHWGLCWRHPPGGSSPHRRL
jgi:hypothetical protein